MSGVPKIDITATKEELNEKRKKCRSRQDSNLRSQRESDFESDALTTRPQLQIRTRTVLAPNLFISIKIAYLPS